MKTALVTGATSGIGRQMAVDLENSGWKVLVHGRDREKTEAVCELCQNSVSFVADLSLLSETQELTDSIRAKFGKLDALVLNAGTITAKRTLTSEGLETMFAVNHMAPYLLTQNLSPILSAKGQILVVSTEAHRWIKKVDLDNLQAEKKFRVLNHYATTKAANILASLEWQHRLLD